nr:hypothetical protein [uncultured Aminipila sp.]
MKECKKEFIKTTIQQQTTGKDFGNTPIMKYLHSCRSSKIGLIVTPKTEKSKPELSKAISKTCYKHCRKYKKYFGVNLSSQPDRTAYIYERR